jgi:hypothetical protein
VCVCVCVQVNQVYNERFRFAGDRVWSAPYAKEVWAKPLLNDSVAVRQWPHRERAMGAWLAAELRPYSLARARRVFCARQCAGCTFPRILHQRCATANGPDYQVVLFNRDGQPCTDISQAKFNPWHRNITCGMY